MKLLGRGQALPVAAKPLIKTRVLSRLIEAEITFALSRDGPRAWPCPYGYSDVLK